MRMDELSKHQETTLHCKLLEQKNTLKGHLVNNADTSKPVQLDQQALGRVSRIDAIQQQEMAIANRANQELTLVKVMKALRRIQEDDYGYCQECDKCIPYERLLIKPETNLCIQCQSALENNA
ncbi:hypothetical protein A9Q81_04650 [Gammaproteobacteria bacterium 42_54_T18]|nr:hypothetical protein A9Q81_04650 [Gammaproteobacteria bacterium 42_54_T18]